MKIKVLLIILIIILMLVMTSCDIQNEYVEGVIIAKHYIKDSEVFKTTKKYQKTYYIYIFIVKTREDINKWVVVTKTTYKKYEVGDHFSGYNLLKEIGFFYLKIEKTEE